MGFSFDIPKTPDIVYPTPDEERDLQKKLGLLAPTKKEARQLYYHHLHQRDIPRHCRIIRIEEPTPCHKWMVQKDGYQVIVLIEVDGEPVFRRIALKYLLWMQPKYMDQDLFEEAIKDQFPIGREELGLEEPEMPDWNLPKIFRNTPYQYN